MRRTDARTQGRTATLVRTLFLCVLTVSTVSTVLTAQCPDGAPPPCRGAARGPAAHSVAVLPFENRARDTSLTLLAEGLADQIATNLGQVQRIELTPPASVRFVLGSTPRDPAQLARALGARWLVDGQLLSSRGSVRVSVQLIDAAERRVRWTGAFQRPTEDLFAVISAVADSVATAIVGTVAPSERARLARRPTTSNAALLSYARGLGALSHFDEASVRYAAAAFESATAADSLFAQAWAGLAEAIMWLDSYQPPRQVYPRARVAAQRALALDPTSVSALAAMAAIAVGYDWDPVRGESLARSALRQDSTYGRAWAYLGDALAAQGRAEEAAPAYRAAVAADTLDEQMAFEAATGLQIARRPDEGLALARRWRERLPQSEKFDIAEAMILVGAHRCAAQPPVSPISLLALACAGRTSQVRVLRDSMVAAAERGGSVSASGVALTFAMTGETEAALRWFARAVEAREYSLVFARVDPMWDSLRGDPRFTALLERIRPA
jgi:serine/threonine-protein kinase